MKLLLITLLFILSALSVAEAKSKGIENYSEAAEGIFRGARPINFDELVELKDKGIKSILNLQGGDLRSKYWRIMAKYEPGEKPEMIAAEKSVAETLGIQFINEPLNSLDIVSEDDNRRIDEALEFMHKKENQPVYIHCEHGHDRTGLVVALYKIKFEKMSVEEAYQEWVNLGHDKKSRIFTGNLDPYFFEKVKEFKK